ncbi:glycoside hydrolase [Setomelanomma holmii]|uniref:chitinase n=1 Tax=Setomelanomma holmii TaxID=210430 RepID=A0A9P4HEF3_9PLEO|nr:glycoside hydrolase [Setomelanomma holmii]
MRFSNVATLFSLAAFAQAASASHAHEDAHTRSVSSWDNSKYQSVIFYVNWAIYGHQHFVTDLPADKLTKINYAFANVNNVTGEVFLTDEWADLQFPYPGDVGTNATQLLGNFNQLYKLKQKNRNLKPALATEAGQQLFCESSLTLLADLGLDGFDIDWEYPEDATDAANFVDTVQQCRKMYDEYAAKYAQGYHFDLSISAPAGPQRYTVLPVKEMDPYVDNWNLMAFDYQGPSFSNFTGHLSNVYASKKNSRATNGWNSDIKEFTPFNTKQAIDYYKANIASPSKIQLGMPMYGRSFANVVDLSKGGRGLGQVFNGSGDGTLEPGTLDYKVLPLNGSKIYTDTETLASWSWDPVKKELVAFDIPDEGLGGAWWWDSSTDRPIDSGKSLVATVVKQLGGPGNFRQSQNNLYYPQSKYYNIRGAAANSTTTLRR